MAWWSRTKKNIEDAQSRDMPDGLWTKCSDCGAMIFKKELEQNYYTCPSCNKHFRIGSDEYLGLILDPDSFEEHASDLVSTDPLNFVDEKPYPQRLADAMRKTDLNDAMRIGVGSIEGKRVSVAVMDFSFIGGSMGSVVGEKFCRAAETARTQRIPFICVTASGGARMMEAPYSLLQLAKTSVRLAQLAEARVPYIAVITDPTTGGVTASYGMLGDVIVAEPKALIGFAGPRVIEQTIKRKLPEGFQRSEFLQEHGFVDHIVHRKDMRQALSRIISFLTPGIPSNGRG